MAKGSGSTRGYNGNAGGSNASAASFGEAVDAAIEALAALSPKKAIRVRVDTEEGYSESLKSAVLKAEAEHRNDEKEYGFVFDKNGVIVAQKRGTSSSINWAGVSVPKDSILTHVHPNDYGFVGYAGRVGSTFSKEDIVFAIRHNLSEIRATTPTYTFSLKRGKGQADWGNTPLNSPYDRLKFMEQVGKSYSKYKKERGVTPANMRKYLNAGTNRRERIGRGYVAGWHQIIKDIAKEYGWEYTWKRIK